MCKPSLSHVLLLGALGATLGLTACAPAATPTRALTPVTVQLNYTHQSQFAGYYAADQNGYYRAEGLQVSFLQGAPGGNRFKTVLDGTAQFGMANADAIIAARANDNPVRAIATIYRRGPNVFIALASSGIMRPQDFVGKKIQVGITGRTFLHTMMARVDVRPDQYTVLDPTADLESLYSGQSDVRLGFVTNEVITAQAAGYKLNIIYPDDYGVHFYADTIFTTDDLIAKSPDLVTRFLRATLKGWTFAVENPTTVGALVVKYNPTADAALENTKMTASLPLISIISIFRGNLSQIPTKL